MYSLTKIYTIAKSTITQLARMKVFYFLLAFCFIILVAGFFFTDTQFEQKLKFFKDVSLGFMLLFTVIFAISGSALIIPKDIEDRTLYTILCKPVTRLEYLLGKFFGICTLLFISLLAMNILFSGALYLKEQQLLAPLVEAKTQFTEANKQSPQWIKLTEEEKAIQNLGLNWNVQKGVFSIFLAGCILASVSILLSTFATSSMFTISVGVCIFIVGYFQALARDYFLRGGSEEIWGKLISAFVTLIFPDFKAFHLADAAASGTPIGNIILIKLVGLALLYVIIYNLIAYLVFAEKEL